VKGISKEAGAALLRDFGVVDDAAKLEEISARVAGHVFVLTQLAVFAVSELDGRLYRYLQQHPELYTDDVSVILTVQLGRRTGAQRQLLKRMSLLRFLTDVRGLTFLRLYEDEWEMDGRLLIMDGSPMSFSKTEQAETQNLIDELVQVSLVEKTLDKISQVRRYRLHPVVTEFFQERFGTKIPDLFQRTQVFYQQAQQSISQDLAAFSQQIQSPILMAQHLGHQGEYLYMQMALLRLTKDENEMSEFIEILREQGLGEIDILLGQGELAYQDNNWNAAEEFFKKALILAQENNKSAEELQSISRLGAVERNRGNWDNAETLFLKSLKLSRKIGDREGLVLSWISLGAIEKNRGNWDSAENFFLESLKLSEELEDGQKIVMSWTLLGLIERDRGNWNTAEKLFWKSLKLSEDLADRPSIAALWQLIGHIECDRGNWDTAEIKFERSLRMRTELKDRVGVARAWMALGNIEYMKENYEIALQMILKSSELYEGLGERLGMCVALKAQAQIFTRQKDFATAENLTYRALELATTLNSTIEVLEIQHVLSNIHLERGELDEAERLLTETLIHMKTLGKVWSIANIHTDLMRIQQSRRDTISAEMHYIIALQIFNELGALKDLERLEESRLTR
jgi:tetratricopeptide (TPR) repeat protein